MSASTTASCPILTYHSQLLFGSDYANNSHVALKDDLARVAASGRRIVPLPQLVEALAGRAAMPDLDRVVCISFDDGPDFDWLDIDHPEHGPQPGFARILREHWAAHPEASPVAASSFVIADASARTAISRSAMDGHDWMHDHWWRAAQDSGLLAIESHGWDHRHEALGDGSDPQLGHFHAVDDETSCRFQIDQASAHIAALCGERPRLFAYPYGQTSDYLRDEYLPRFEHRHAIVGAVSVEPGYCHPHSSRWFLPRFVHAAHWQTPEQLGAILRG